jgi:hypothetical protein
MNTPLHYRVIRWPAIALLVILLLPVWFALGVRDVARELLAMLKELTDGQP